MLLHCPHCDFRRSIPTAAHPPHGELRVVCASCGREFSVIVPEADFAFDSDGPHAPAPRTLADAPKAGFWIRVLASLIDSVILTLTQSLLGGLLGVMLSLLGGGTANTSLVVIWLFGSAIGLAYYILFTAHGGQTPGKMALRLKVISTDGGEVGLGKACYRETVCKFIAAIILGIGYLMVAFDEKKQGLHDRMAGTYVVKL